MTCETKREKFIRMYDVRFPKAVKALELLANLSGRDYDPHRAMVASMIEQLEDRVDTLREVFGMGPRKIEKLVSWSAPKGDKDTLSQTEMYKLAWAYDRLQAGDTEMGMGLIKKILQERNNV